MPDQLSRGTPARVFQSSLSICRSRSTTTPLLRVQPRFYSAQTLTSPTRSSPLANLLASTLSKVSTGIPRVRLIPKNFKYKPNSPSQILHPKKIFSPFLCFLTKKLFLTSDIAALLRRLPAREELNLAAARDFTTTPRTCEVDFPFGSVQNSVPPSSEEDEPPTNPTKRPRTEDQDDLEPGSSKFSKTTKFNCNTAFNIAKQIPQHVKFQLPDQMQNKHWEEKYLELSSLAVSSSTWKSRLSSLNKFKAFAKSTGTNISWPLSKENRNGFVVWCYDRSLLSANTVDKYLVHLNSIQSFLGFKKFNKSKDQTMFLLKGLKNARNRTKKPGSSRKAITFQILKTIKRKIKHSIESKLLAKTLWCACNIAFFGCFRLGKILPKNPHSFDLESDLLWNDVKIHKKYVSIRIKSPKITTGYPNKIYLFNFKEKSFCPVRCLKKLKKIQKFNDLFVCNQPVFRTNSKKFLTQKDVNKFLKEKFPELNIRGHSFRAGIPTTIANFPELTDDNHAMGWGRWRSKAFSSYQKAKRKQKKWIFRKIEKALLSPLSIE